MSFHTTLVYDRYTSQPAALTSQKAIFDQQHNEITYNSTLNPILECGPMPNVMAALLNIGGALC